MAIETSLPFSIIPFTGSILNTLGRDSSPVKAHLQLTSDTFFIFKYLVLD